jgi:mgtE-like transporter
MPTRSVFRVIEETMPLIILYAVIELLAGGMLGGMLETIEILPGLLIILPGLLDMRGSIGSTFGARLTSGMHLGTIRPYRLTGALKTNIYASVILSFLLPVLLGVLAWVLCVVLGLGAISLTAFIVISLFTGFISGIALTGLAILVSFVSYNKGLDPDDVTTPTIGTLGDIITVLCLFVAVHLVLSLGI